MQIDSFLDSTDFSAHTELNARRTHDALMLLLCFREHPVTRPTCMRLLLVPGVQEPCSQCTVPGCLGNSWVGNVAVIRHYKTASTYGNHTITVQPGSRTEQVLQEYCSWARPLLLKDTSSNALFLTRFGRPFIRDGCFNKYLPRLLQQLSGAKLSWTKVSSRSRRCTQLRSCALLDSRLARPDSFATSPPTGSCHWPLLTSWRAWLPACRPGTHAQLRATDAQHAEASRSTRKLTSVYHDNRREFVAQLGLQLYQSAGGAAAGSESEGESDEEDGFQQASTPAALPPPVQQLQLAVVPVQQQVASPGAGEARVRAPMAHLLSLVPAKRLPAGALRCACHSTHLQLSFWPGVRAGGAGAAPGGRQGRPHTHTPLAGHAYLTRQEVEELWSAGGSRALKNAFKWLYGSTTKSGNMKWLRHALTGP